MSSLLSSSCHAANTTASLSITTPNMITTAVQGTTATVSTKVTVNVTNAKEYNLMLKVDNANLTNGNTTIAAGNATTNNTWGYKWDKDGTSTYRAPSTTGTTLTTPALANNAANFEGTLTFAAKFADNANPGSYKNEGSIMLTATPNSVTLSSISNMQEMTPEICEASSIEETKQLKDTRDNKLYWVAKLKDNRCWMVQNLDYDVPGVKVETTVPANSSSTPSIYDPGLKVVSGNSFVNTGSSDTHRLVGNFYNLHTATDDSSSSSTGNAAKSICADGWRLPTGNTTGEYATLTNNVTASALLDAPYYYVLGGSGALKQEGACSSEGCDYSYGFGGIGSRAGYWTSSGAIPGWYSMTISSTTIKHENEYRGVWAVYNIRCIANN